MLEIKTKEEFNYEENVGEESWFELDGIEGHHLFECNWYEPLEYQFMRIEWNGCKIEWSGSDYWVKGTIPTDNQLKEISDAFDRGMYDIIKAGKYKTFN